MKQKLFEICKGHPNAYFSYTMTNDDEGKFYMERISIINNESLVSAIFYNNQLQYFAGWLNDKEMPFNSVEEAKQFLWGQQ